VSTRRGLLGGALLVFVTVLTGCVSALGEPPPIEKLAPDVDGGESPAGDAAALRDEASALLERSTDAGAVNRACSLFLDAVARDPLCLECYLGAARAIAWLIEHEGDSGRRKELAIEGVQVGQLCRQAVPQAPECRYRLALAVGQQARERTATATDGLDVMVELLEELVDEAPTLDSAGPHRVLALVLLRAPGWPTGPGDPERALEHARAAVDLVPDYPPNQLVLGEALRDNDRPAEARSAFERAIDLATRLAAAGHGEAGEWRDEGLDFLAAER
jgi:tetratricopeptide (TPR) repeat protein